MVSPAPEWGDNTFRRLLRDEPQDGSRWEAASVVCWSRRVMGKTEKEKSNRGIGVNEANNLII